MKKIISAIQIRAYSIYALSAVIIILAAGSGYLWRENTKLTQGKLLAEESLVEAEKQVASVVQRLQEVTQTLASTETERARIEKSYTSEKKRMDAFSSQISSLSSTVGVLKKVSDTDEELIKKYSKIYFLNENYVPKSLVPVDSLHAQNPQKVILIHGEAWPHLKNLLASAHKAGIGIDVVSGYRSFGEQADIKQTYSVTYGAGTANQFSADQGYSEHQLGTTVDFSTPELGADFSDFARTTAYAWLQKNAHIYGFVLSYPENNSYYVFEPWHWRFVSRDLAQKLFQEQKHFYDLDQRVLDTYLVSFFD